MGTPKLTVTVNWFKPAYGRILHLEAGQETDRLGSTKYKTACGKSFYKAWRSPSYFAARNPVKCAKCRKQQEKQEREYALE